MVRKPEVLQQPSADEGSWKPKFHFDFHDGSAKKFQALTADYSEWHELEPVTGPVLHKDGWHEVTSQLAESWLRRNLPGANRKASWGTIRYYGRQMEDGDWPKTGQAVIFDSTGKLIDGQHRLWACLLSGKSFWTYLVTNVPAIPRLFAYLDNNKPRTPAVALQTAGYNGVSTIVAQILKIESEIAGYTPSSAPKAARLAPIDIVRMAESIPNAMVAARAVVTDYKGAVSIVGKKNKNVLAYVVMKILDLHGTDRTEEFFEALMDYSDDNDVIMKLRTLLEENNSKKDVDKQLKPHAVLGNMIKAFNAWHLDIKLPKKWTLTLDEDFPKFVGENSSDEESAEAAE